MTPCTVSVMTPTTTPTGEPGIKLTCTDPGHWHHGKSAIIRHTDNRISKARACKLIDAAYHPFAGAASVQRFGPWQA